MSSIIKSKSGKYTYLYESNSYRNKQGQPRSKRKCVGRIDPDTGKEVYKAEYLERVAGTDQQPSIDDGEKLFSANDIKASKNREFGVQYLLDRISETTGLLAALQHALPRSWESVLALTHFIVATGEPSMYCEDWLNRTDSIGAGQLTSQKISALLASITDAERVTFFEKWSETRQEQEYFALDITSVSSYSELIGDVAWGYNRDGEDLPQINICMLVGEKSKLPIFSIVYNGALKDVSTLKATLAMASGISLNNIQIVMDKGFASKKNIDAMLKDKDNVRFLISLPFTMKFTKQQVESERNDIDTLENTIIVGGDILRGISRLRSWDSTHDLNALIFFNPVLASKRRNELYGRIATLREKALTSEDGKVLDADAAKYLTVRKSTENSCGVTVSTRMDVVEKELLHTGWMVAVSNFVSDAKEALIIYRTKDVVEKGFLRLKNCLGLSRLRVHSDEAMQNKIFIGFIALIITAYIHKVMSDNSLYDDFTMKKLLKALETLRVQYIKGQRILYPLSLAHKSIISAFGFELPL